MCTQTKRTSGGAVTMAPWFVGTYPGTDLSGSASTPTTQNCRRYDAHSEDVASPPSGYGPPVQLFGVRVSGALIGRAAVPTELRSLIDPLEDQVQIYPTTPRPSRSATSSEPAPSRSAVTTGSSDDPRVSATRGERATSPTRTGSPRHGRKRLGPRRAGYRRSAPVPPTRRTRQDDHNEPAAPRCSQTLPSALVRPPGLPLLSLRIARFGGHRN